VAYSEEFEKCWKLYPARNGKKAGKKQAFEAWKNLSNGDRRVVATDLKLRLKDTSWKSGEFVPDMVRYLKHRRWEDEMATVEHEPRPNTYTEPPVKLPQIQTVANRVMLHVLTGVGGVDKDTLRDMYKVTRRKIGEFHEQKASKEFVSNLKDSLFEVARGFDAEKRAAEIEEAYAAYRVRQGITT